MNSGEKMGLKITGLDELMKTLSDPKQLAKDMIDNDGGYEMECPNCQKLIKVPTTGTTCSCGQKIVVEFTN
ncbi:hypothetical protein [Vagococcus fluvialis]|uniref:hypothetical protein n=1 Tax=Vagococcus fluvialis TaxID=2738 RepID=UPI003D0C5C35